ncbi:MAG: hypothetical protein IJ902_09265 [Prevotella sp.]|nr:hypothetical protein [Prevotella sp.]
MLHIGHLNLLHQARKSSAIQPTS